MTIIAQNKKAHFDYTIEDTFVTGLVLEGWEVKSARVPGAVDLVGGYIYVRDGELFLGSTRFNPQRTTQDHSRVNDPKNSYWAYRPRKLLLKKSEIKKIVGKATVAGYTLVALDLHFEGRNLKCTMALAKGKKKHDKRAADKDRSTKKEVEQAMKSNRSNNE